MAEITLTADTGRATGTRSANRLRREGKVPGVVYGRGTDPLTVAVEWRDLRQALTTEAGVNAMINLEVDGDRKLTIVKELQRDPVRRSVTHVDFIVISRDEAIEVEVPIVLEGEAIEVARENGMVDHVLYHLTVKAKPGSIPNELTADVSGLTVGDSIRVGDLSLPSGVTTDVDPEEAVAVATITRETLEIEAEEAAAEAEAAAEGAEGEEGAEAGAAAEAGAEDDGGGDRGEQG